MDILSVLFPRRSIRNYEERKLERDILVQLLQAAMAAPSAANAQPWEFVVIDEPKNLRQLKEARTQFDAHRIHWQVYELRKRQEKVRNAKHQ